MKKSTKKQLIALFILIMFGGSTITYAIISIFPGEQQEKLIFDVPLTNQEEAKYFQQNRVVMRIYYDYIDEDLFIETAEMIDTLGQKMIIERIDVNQFPEYFELIQGKSGYQDDIFPVFFLRGNTEILLQGERDDLLENLCSLYFEEIDECFLFN